MPDHPRGRHPGDRPGQRARPLATAPSTRPRRRSRRRRAAPIPAPMTPCATASTAKDGAAALTSAPAVMSAAPALSSVRSPGAAAQRQHDGGDPAGRPRQRAQLPGGGGRDAEVARELGQDRRQHEQRRPATRTCTRRARRCGRPRVARSGARRITPRRSRTRRRRTRAAGARRRSRPRASSHVHERVVADACARRPARRAGSATASASRGTPSPSTRDVEPGEPVRARDARVRARRRRCVAEHVDAQPRRAPHPPPGERRPLGAERHERRIERDRT